MDVDRLRAWCQVVAPLTAIAAVRGHGRLGGHAVAAGTDHVAQVVHATPAVSRRVS
jgi:hypothetical protein